MDLETLARIGLRVRQLGLHSQAHHGRRVGRSPAEDDDVRYATLIALANAGTPEALALIRDKGPKDKALIIRKLSERLLSAN